MLLHLERCNISGCGRWFAFGLLLVVSSSCLAQAQSIKIEQKLVGTWHSVEIHCAADEECANTVNEAQLDISRTGTFELVLFTDLGKSDVCSWELSEDEPNTLDFDECDDPAQDSIDTIRYRLSGNALILTGIEEANPPVHEAITMRFERGPLITDWRKPAPEVCNTEPLPEWAASAHQIASDWDLEWPRPGVTDPPSLIPGRNQLLWNAVRAYKGIVPPIALKSIAYSIEGDKLEEYLFASRDKVEVVRHTDKGLMERLETCTLQVPIIKLREQDADKVWHFVSAPSLVTRVYIVFPGDESGPHTFPRF